MNWTGGRLHLYSNVTRRGTLKDQTRRMIHRTSARTLKEWTWPVGKRHKEVAEMDKAVQSSCGNAASNARPATALPLMEPASDHRVKERRQWAESSSVRSMGHSSLLSSTPYGSQSIREGSGQRKGRTVVEARRERPTSIDMFAAEESEEELDLSDEEVLRFTKRNKEPSAIMQHTRCHSEDSSNYRPEEGRCRLSSDHGTRLRPLPRCHHLPLNASDARYSTLQTTSDTYCMVDNVIGNRLNDVSATEERHQTVRDVAQLEELRTKLLKLDDWAMLRLSKPLRWKRRSGGRRG